VTAPTYRIRPAGPDDLEDVVELRRYAEEWLAAAGINQWTNSSTGDRAIREHFDDGRLFVVEDHAGYVVASLALGPGDPAFWTPSELGEPALHLFKFMAGPTARGTGLGDVLLDWACHQVETADCLHLRLDCWRTNAGLHQYYVRRGFTQLDTRSAPGRMSGALFERPAAIRLASVGVQLVDGTDGDALFNRPATSTA
jgi:GNAT superfamily N-acetyltransferase